MPAITRAAMEPVARPAFPGASRVRPAAPYTAFARIYDAAMGEAVLPTVIDNFAVSRRKFAARTDVMADVGCGTGRFLRYLTRFAGRLYGVDRSPAMLRLAARNLRGKGVTLLRMDMRALRLPEPVDTLTCMFDTINYLLAPADLRRTFARFAAALKPGGTMLFDFIPQGAAQGPLRLRQRVRVADTVSDWRMSIDPAGRGSRAVIRISTMADAGRTNYYAEMHEQKWHAVGDVRAALRDNGFEMLELRPAEPAGGRTWLHCVARFEKRVSGVGTDVRSGAIWSSEHGSKGAART